VADGLIVVVSRFEFAKRLRQEFEEPGIRIREVESWKGALDLLEVDDSIASLAIIDAELASDFAESSPSDRRLHSQSSWPVFLISESTPSQEQVTDAYRAGFIGYLSCESPLEETVFRVQACIDNRDQRTYTATPRAAILGPVRLTVRNREGDRSASGLLGNISRTGMMLRMISPPEVGSRVTASLWLQQRLEPIAFHGRVVWRDGGAGSGFAGAAGIEFDEMDAPNQSFLLDYVLRVLDKRTPR